jgi:hypothetical protein
MVELPIFFYTEEQHAAADLKEQLGLPDGGNEDFSEYEVRNVLFTGGIVVVPYRYGSGFPYTRICSQGSSWVCKLSYEEVIVILRLSSLGK